MTDSLVHRIFACAHADPGKYFEKLYFGVCPRFPAMIAATTKKWGEFAHLSSPHPSWLEVAAQQEALDRFADTFFNLPLPEFRAVGYKPPPLPTNVPLIGRDIVVDEIEIPVRDGTDIGLRIYRPKNSGRNHALFFNIHGGGWTVGTPETEEAQNRLICAKNNAVVASVDYRRAPEFPFPHALHDAQDAFRWCMNNKHFLGVDSEKSIIGGGSAGANIAAALAQLVRDEGTAGIIGQILNIPVTCHPDHFPRSRYEFHSFEQNANAPIVNASRMRKFWSNYLPTSSSEPLASPLLAASLEHLPPALIQVAGMDPLRDEGLAYARGLRSAGVEVELRIYEGMPHAFYVYPNLPPSAQYFQSMVDWIEKLLSKHESNKLTRC